jgi:hypothetical protein
LLNSASPVQSSSLSRCRYRSGSTTVVPKPQNQEVAWSAFAEFGKPGAIGDRVEGLAIKNWVD